MLWNWIFFLSFVSAAYVGISYVGQMTGGESTSAGNSAMRLFKPSIFIPMVLANAAFSASLYYGFLATSTALTVAVSVGVIVSFVYSVIVVGATISAAKLLGVGFILVGVYLVR